MVKKSLVLVVLAAFAASGAQANSATYAIDPTHTSVMFEALHFGTSTNRARFDRKAGTVSLDKAARTGRVEFTLETASVSSGVAPLDKHLQSDDFFASAQFPTATFVGDRFTFTGDKLTEVAGQLTLRGKTHPVTLKAKRFNCYDHPLLRREVCGGDFEATIKRSLWGVDWGLEMGVPDDTRLVVQVEAIRQ